MAKTAINQLKNWFLNGMKPPQEHFWNWMDSFWHKDEQIPMNTIDGLETALSEKAETSHIHPEYAKRDATNMANEDVDAWKQLLYDNENGQLTDQHIQLTDGYPDFSIPPESTQKDFNDVISSEVSALKEADETPYMTTNSINTVTSDWVARMTNLVDTIRVNFQDNTKFLITQKGSFDTGWRVIFHNGNIELESFEDMGLGNYGWVPKGVFLKEINGETSADGELILNDANLLTSKDFVYLSVTQDEPLTNLFDQIIARLNILGSAVQNGIKTPTGINCNTNPNYPSSVKGDSYKVTSAGKIGGSSGVNVEIGDLIVCTDSNAGGTHASVGSNYFIVQTNLEQATESTVGFAKIATSAQTTSGTDDTTIITPKKLQDKITANNSSEATVNDGKYVKYSAAQSLTAPQKTTARGNIGAADDTTVVHLTGNETVAGTKTFSTIPVLPASNPTQDNQAVRKKYVDDNQRTEATLSLTQAYSFFGLTASNKQKDFNEKVMDESLIETTIIPLTAYNENIANLTHYSGISYMPYKVKILDIRAVSEIAPTGADIKISVLQNGNFIGVTEPYLIIPTSGRINTNTHDITNTDLAVGDRLRFYTNQIGSLEPGKGVQIILKTKKNA